MKNMYRVTRPAWAAMDKYETALIFIATVVLGFYEFYGKRFASSLLPKSNDGSWYLIDAAIVTLFCLMLIRAYQRLRVWCYPSTFIYCFYIPGPSNPRGKSQVVGYCCIEPNMDNGEVTVEGASFFWENGELDTDSRVGFKSTHVRGTEENGETTCHIRFNINEEDRSKRLYRHGLLQFRLASSLSRVQTEKRSDVYAGYLQSMSTDSEIQDVEVQSKGRAERWRKGKAPEEEIQGVLKGQGDVLFAGLDTMLKVKPPQTLWRDRGHMRSDKKNVWGHQIPTPQSVILNDSLRTNIDRFLDKVLASNGLQNDAIAAFKRRARVRAAVDDILFSYEKDLRASINVEIVDCKRDEALNQRAQLIVDEISPFFDGNSLLDIGCGNGLIANLVRDRFPRMQLLDVVQYVPKALNLPFLQYKEGQKLPVSEPFDTVLLITVLHHAANPVELLKLAWASTQKRLIIIESVVGVHNRVEGANYDLLNSSDEDQIAYAAFVDWFYNRVLHDVPVPYNFTTPEKWKSIFVENNMDLAGTAYLGQDIDIGPEYHVLFVLEKQHNKQVGPRLVTPSKGTAA